MSSSSVRGVETNEFSRFVDHTLATPWETLVSDIEKGLRFFQSQRQALKEYERALQQERERETRAQSESHSSSPIPTSDSLPSLLLPAQEEPPKVKHIVSIQYRDFLFSLEEFSAASSQREIERESREDALSAVLAGRRSLLEHNWLSAQLSLDRFLLFYPNLVRGSAFPVDWQTTLFSAFCVAVKALGETLSLPVFATTSLINLSSEQHAIRRLDCALVDELIGFRRVSLSPTGCCWLRYSSNCFRAMAMNSAATTGTATAAVVNSSQAAQAALLQQTPRCHPLFFFDGVRKLYQKKVRSLYPSLAHTQADELFSSSVRHSFAFPRELWVSACASLSASPTTNTSNNTSAASSSSSSLPLFLSDYLSQQLAVCLSSSSSSSSSSPSFLSPALYQKLVCETITASIDFHERRQTSVIDNDTYSSFLPAKQPPHFWRLSASFQSTPYAPPLLALPLISALSAPSIALSPSAAQQRERERERLREEEQLDVLALTQWKAQCVHKLLSFLMAMSFASQRRYELVRRELSLEHSLSLERLFDDRVFEEMQRTAGSLSPALQRRFLPSMFPEEFLDKMVAEHTLLQSLSNNNSNNNTSSSAASSPMPLSPARSSLPLVSLAETESSRSPVPVPTTPGSAMTDNNRERDDKSLQHIVKALFPPNSPSSTVDVRVSVRGLHDVRNWFQSFALIAGLSDSLKGLAVIDLWQACMREFQTSFDADRPIGWHAFAPRSPALPVPASVTDTSSFPIYAQALWNDLLSRKRDSGVAYPDLSQSVLLQKLQMIHFCLEMKSESAVCELPQNKRDLGLFQPKLFRRVPLTSDVLALQQHIVNKFTSNSSSNSGSSTGAATNAEKTSSEAVALSSTENSSSSPLLPYQVRLPSLVSDMNCFRAANRDADLRSFCKWYGLLAREENEKENDCIDAAAIEPKEDYTNSVQQSRAMLLPRERSVEEEETMLRSLEEIWREQSAPLGCEQQKTIFSAEKELGKAIAYLDRLSAVDFAFQLVFEAIVWIRDSFHFLIERYVPSVHDSHRFDDEQQDSLDVLMRRFERLFENLQEHQLNRYASSSARATASANPVSSSSSVKSSPQCPSSSARSASPTPAPSPLPTSSNSRFLQELHSPAALGDLFRQLDEMALLIEEIEVLLAKIVQVHALVNALHSSQNDRRSMLTRWLSTDSVSAEETYSLRSEEEAKNLRSVIKTIHNRNGRGHDWHSYDGRELGMPQRKEFRLRSFSKSVVSSCVAPSGTSNKINETSHQTRTISKSLEESVATRLNFADDADGASKDKDKEEQKTANSPELELEDLRDYEMLAMTDGQTIRVVCSQVEKD